MQGKQAKIVSPTQERAMLGSLATTRSPARDRVLFLLSMKAGLRAKAIASLTWAHGDRCHRAGCGGAPRAQPRQ
jgi:integrase